MELLLPQLEPRLSTLEAFFRSRGSEEPRPLRNVHFESLVSDETAARATRASVLIAFVPGDVPEILLTRRHHSISAPGHICFPGGRSDSGDGSPIETALREAEEEIALDRSRVRVLGRLGEYVSHSGFRIAPVVGVVDDPGVLVPREGEVEEILSLPWTRAFDSSQYQLRRHPDRADGSTHAHYFLVMGAASAVTGPTVSILMGLYEALVEFTAGDG